MEKHELNLEDFLLDEIESIELVGEEDTIDITVDDTHMFYCNDIYTHNSAIKSEVVEADQIGGSIKKGQIAHFICSISKTLEQRENHTANMAVLKSRIGHDGIVFENIRFDNSRIQIDMNNTNNGGSTFGQSKDNKKADIQNKINIFMDASLKAKENN